MKTKFKPGDKIACRDLDDLKETAVSLEEKGYKYIFNTKRMTVTITGKGGEKSMKIRAIVKRVDEPIGHVTAISNSLRNLQKTVGGYIETVTFFYEGKPVVVICNEEGRLLGLPYNCTIGGVDFCGDIIAVGVDGDEFTDLPESISRKTWARDMLGRKVS